MLTGVVRGTIKQHINRRRADHDLSVVTILICLHILFQPSMALNCFTWNVVWQARFEKKKDLDVFLVTSLICVSQ